MVAANDVTVLTAILGPKDMPTNAHNTGGSPFVAVTSFDANVSPWRVFRPPVMRCEPRLLARLVKLMPWVWVDTSYSIWIDSTVVILKEPRYLIETYLEKHDIAVMRHPLRHCVYDEADVIIQR